jgi:hypothetical protein
MKGSPDITTNSRDINNEFLIHADGSGLRQLTAVSSATHQMLSAVWIDGGKRIHLSRIDPHILPVFGGVSNTFA